MKSPKFNQSFILSSFFMTATGLFASFLAFLFNFIIVKQISPTAYGEYNAANAYCAILTAPLTVFGLIIVKKIGAKAQNKRDDYARVLEIKLFRTWQKRWYLLMLLAVALAFLFFKFANFTSFTTTIYVLITTGLTFFSVFYTSALNALKNFFWISLIAIISSSLKFAGGLTVVRIWPYLEIIYLVLLILPACTALLSRYQTFKKLPKKNLEKLNSPSHISLTSALFNKEFLIPFLSILTTTLIINSDLIIAKLFFTAEQAGIYSLFSLFAKIILYATTPIINVAYSFFTGNESSKKSLSILLMALGFFGLFGFGMIAFYSLFPELLIELVGSKDYLLLSSDLFLAAIFGMVYSMVMLLSQYLVAKNSWLIIFGVIASIIQLILLFLNHSSYVAVMNINILISVLLITVYGLILTIKYLKKKYGASYQS